MSEHDLVPTHVTQVVAAEQISDSFVRVTFGGGLERFRPAGPDDFVYVLLPPPGRRTLPIDTTFRWTDYDAMAESERPLGAYYTVRHFRPERGELDCDVYLHEPCGHVSAWALQAKPGDVAALWGPRTAWQPPVGTTDWILAADETGIPAVAAIMEQRPAALPARVFLEVAGAGARPSLRCGDGVTVTWLERARRPAGTTDLLVEAVRSAPAPSSTTYAWGGAESRAMTAIRRYLRHEVGLAKEQVSMTPYWRHADHAEELADDGD